MKAARRHRRKILLLFSLFALGALTVGYFRRIGCDPMVGAAKGPAHTTAASP